MPSPPPSIDIPWIPPPHSLANQSCAAARTETIGGRSLVAARGAEHLARGRCPTTRHGCVGGATAAAGAAAAAAAAAAFGASGAAFATSDASEGAKEGEGGNSQQGDGHEGAVGDPRDCDDRERMCHRHAKRDQREHTADEGAEQRHPRREILRGAEEQRPAEPREGEAAGTHEPERHGLLATRGSEQPVRSQPAEAQQCELVSLTGRRRPLHERRCRRLSEDAHLLEGCVAPADTDATDARLARGGASPVAVHERAVHLCHTRATALTQCLLHAARLWHERAVPLSFAKQGGAEGEAVTTLRQLDGDTALQPFLGAKGQPRS
mmetsp:Transcript_26852/g.68334  ORF Transcript_26852/g.68334 Transcript_26852/m.68334 type:complete len:323 (-) Transcript_26852:614-1582(-)